MKRLIPRLLAAALFAGAVAGVACSDDGTVDTDRVADQAKTSATQVRQEAQNTWASLRTDGNRLIDDVQTRKDPDAKKQLLDRCRDTQEQFRKKDDGANADRVGKFCDRVRDADPNAQGAWNDIKSEFQKLDEQFRS